MSLWDAPVRDLRPVAVDERRRLLTFLEGLTPSEWIAASAAPGWTVQDLALHLLDDDLSWLSHRRDGSTGALVDMSDRRRFVELLAAKNQRWVDAARVLSPRVVIDLLAWAGDEVDAFHARCDLRGDGWVSWASSEAVPFWFNLAQEFTERWVHQQQMREAVGRVEDHADHLPEVLGTFMWAVQHQLGQPTDAATTLEVRVSWGGLLDSAAQRRRLGDGGTCRRRPDRDRDAFARRRVAPVHRRDHPTGSSRGDRPDSNHRRCPAGARHHHRLAPATQPHDSFSSPCRQTCHEARARSVARHAPNERVQRRRPRGMLRLFGGYRAWMTEEESWTSSSWRQWR